MTIQILIEKQMKTEKEYFRELGIKWRKSLPRYSDEELLKAFPEAGEIISEKIKEAKKDYQAQKKLIKEILKDYEDREDKWFIEEYIKVFLMEDLLEYERRVKKLEFFNHPCSTKNGLSEIEIQRAREYPILEVAEKFFEIQESGSRYKALCPFHNEKNPSFFIFPETNRFYCFGCHEKGDVIKLTMALYGISFIDAVKMLQN